MREKRNMRWFSIKISKILFQQFYVFLCFGFWFYELNKIKRRQQRKEETKKDTRKSYN